MGFFANLGPLHVFREVKPFRHLRTIKWRADQLLKKRTPEELEAAALEIHEVISRFKEEYVAEETERYVSRLCDVGGWELAYLPTDEDGLRPSEADIRALLQNWPSWADDQPDLPSADDIDDLDAFQEIINSDYLYSGIGNGLQVSEAEAYAVIALMRLDEAASFLFIPEKKTADGTSIYAGPSPWEKRHVIAAGNLIVEAMEIICFAERELSDEKLRELRNEQKEVMVSQVEAAARKKTSRLALDAKYASNTAARNFVKKEWAAHRSEYDNNKSAFVRSYVAIVANKFNDSKGNPLKITEKQMRESWLAEPRLPVLD